MDRRPWPEAIDALVDPDAEVVAEHPPGRWRVGDHMVMRLASEGPAGDGSAVVDRLSADGVALFLVRLAEVAPFAVPRVIGADGRWLVAARPTGHPADRPELQAEPGLLAGLVGAGLAALHRLSPSLRPGAAPTDAWAAIVDRCRRSVADGRIAEAGLPPPYDRYRPERLVEMLETEYGTTRSSVGPPGTASVGSGRVEPGGSGAAVDPPVLCHGAATTGRFLIDGGRLIGFDAIEEVVVADRHLDLAAAHLSVSQTLGSEAVFAFYEGYGSDPDLARLDRAMLAIHLLGLGRAPSEGR